MKMMSKVIFTMIAMLSLILFVGCGSGEKSDKNEKTKLTMMVFPSTESYETINEKFMEKFPEFTQKVDIQVELGGSGDDDVASKLRLALSSGNDVPDIIRLNYTQLPEFAESGALFDIGEYIEPYDDKIIDAAKNIMKYDNTYYALPREVKPKMWFYRADIFEECGIDISKIKNMDDYIAAGEKIQEKYPNAHMENYNIPTQSYDLMIYMSLFEEGFCDDTGKYDLANNEAVKKTFKDIKKMHDSAVNSKVVEWSADWAPSFESGELVSQLIAGWFKTDFKNFNLESQKGKWALAPWPEEIRAGSDAGGAIWVIPNKSKNKELAAELMTKMCFDEDSAKIIYDVTGVIPALKSAATDETYNGENEYYVSSLGQVNSEAMESLKIFPYNPSSSQEIKIVMQYLDEYLQDNLDLDSALKKANVDLVNQIGNPLK